MRFSIDKATGMHEEALYVRSKRNTLIASNLANSDTPNYKSRDVDFREILTQVAGFDDGSKLKMTNATHMQPGGSSAADAEVLYRYPFQAAIDGNTVDAAREKAEFAQNTVQYQATLEFLTGRLKGIKSAIKGVAS